MKTTAKDEKLHTAGSSRHKTVAEEAKKPQAVTCGEHGKTRAGEARKPRSRCIARETNRSHRQIRK